jgi:G3E family GTPase
MKPVTILSGFLGSGKTTLLNYVLKENHGLKLAVIVNEFGEIGLDGGLVSGGEQFVKMDNGCLCCALNDDLVETLSDLKNRDDFDAVILETTGIADPLSVAWTFTREQFKNFYRVSALVTVIDALHYQKMLTHGMETTRQIERADILFLSKLDLVENPSDKIDEIKNELNKINSHARYLSKLDPDWMKLIFETKDESLSIKEEPNNHHHHSYQSISIPLENENLKLEDLEDLFENLPPEIFRAKAVFKNPDHKITVIHGVCGRVEFYYDPNYQGKLGAVFIGKDFDQDMINQLWKKYIV